MKEKSKITKNIKKRLEFLTLELTKEKLKLSEREMYLIELETLSEQLRKLTEVKFSEKELLLG